MASRSLWILNHYAAAPDRPAGTRHYDLGSELAERGYEVTIFAAGFSHFTLREERLRGWQLFRTQWFGRVRFVWIRTIAYQGNTALRLLNMLSYTLTVLVVQLRFGRPKWVIGSSVHPFAALAGYLIARFRRATFLYEIRDLWPQTLIDMGALAEQSLAAKVLRYLERMLAERSAAVITLLPEIDRYLTARHIRAARVEYLPNGVLLSRDDASTPEWQIPKQLRDWLDEGRFVCAYVGVHGAANRLDVLLTTADWLRDRGDDRVRIALVGDGPEKQRLKAMAERLSLPNLAFLDPIPKSAVPSLLSHADATLFHLGKTDVFRYGISSNKLFDYLASRKPVIFACKTRYDPVAIAGAGISVPPEEPEALAHAMLALSTTPPSQLAEMGNRGRRYVENHHAIKKLGSQLDRLLKQEEAA